MTFGENNFLAAGIHTAAVCSGHIINRLLLRQKTALAKVTVLIFPLVAGCCFLSAELAKRYCKISKKAVK